jgi:hypothetical protein
MEDGKAAFRSESHDFSADEELSRVREKLKRARAANKLLKN